MLYAPAICDDCDAVFASDLIVAEHPGEPTSYRRSAGPCPHCGGRGHIPEWVHRFHATAVDARDRATPEQISSLTAALRHHLNPPQPAQRNAPGPDLTTELVGPWQVVAFELRHSPAQQLRAQLTLLLWMMLDEPTPPRQGPHRSVSSGNGWAGPATDGARQGTTTASTSGRDGTRRPPATGPAGGFTIDGLGGATDLVRPPGTHVTVLHPPAPGHPGGCHHLHHHYDAWSHRCRTETISMTGWWVTPPVASSGAVRGLCAAWTSREPSVAVTEPEASVKSHRRGSSLAVAGLTEVTADC